MNKNRLLIVMHLGESQTVEFKTSFQKEIIETIVAFANTEGGHILIGVNDHGDAVGIKTTNETFKEWINQIKVGTQPNIIPEIEEIEVDGKTVGLITVQENPVKPVAYKNRYYKRVKNSNHQMSLDEISNEHLKMINSSWDYQIDNRHSFDDISMDKVIGLIETIAKHQKKTFDEDPMTILRKYELLKDDKLTFGAYLLFVDNYSAITSFQIGRFKSDTHIIDNIDLDTDLLCQIDRAIEFIRKHLMIEYIITGEPQREERYNYPLEAIREIVTNMVVHRDYRDSGNSIIKIFDDRIEFYNPGQLYGGITIDQLENGEYSSRTRNRAVSRIFKECGIIERYGSGISRIQKECNSHGIRKPIFEEFVQGFRVTLFNKIADEGVSEGVSEGVKQIYEFIKKNNGKRVPFLAQELNTSTKNIERWIKQLKEENKVEFRGAPKTGGYFVLEK